MSLPIEQWEKDLVGAVASLVAVGPANLLKRINVDRDDDEVTETDLVDMLKDDNQQSSEGVRRLALALSHWDFEQAPSWDTGGDATNARSVERRAKVYELLRLSSAAAQRLNDIAPVATMRTTVISTKWTPWYTEERRTSREFYWPHYKDYLSKRPGFSAEAVAALDLATEDVVQRLSDPTSDHLYQSKGLVVGYVQSGKTANFTGVIAKAIDAGYRLIIVMTGTIEMLLNQQPPSELTPIVEWFEAEDDARERLRWVLRDSLDELLDGQRTGRWAYHHLSKTEKTHLGTVVEVNLTKEFEFANGDHLDWQIAGIDIDCKFSKDVGKWEIPMEMYLCADHNERQGKADHPALLTWFDDTTNRWAAGLITITDERLRWKVAKPERAYNRDNKRSLANASAELVYWLWGGLQSDLPRNLLLHLAPDVRARILSPTPSGQMRVNQLFRELQGQIVGRQTVLTVAQQDDAPKRVRDARIHLRQEGIVVLGHQGAHPKIATSLELPAPVKGEWIAVRVTPVSESDIRPFVTMHGQRWARAHGGDPVVAVSMDYRRLS